MYRPSTGARFLTRDPLEAITRSAYGYAGNNPINTIDPSGMCPFCVAFVVGAVVGGGLDLGFQMLGNAVEGCGLLSGINWTRVAISGGVGGVFGAGGYWLKASRGAGLIDDVLPKPGVSNGRLSNIVDDLYKGTTNPGRVGSGTTADAVRNELATGIPTGGTFHTRKAIQYSSALTRLLKQDLSYHDRLVAQSLLDDLQRALGGLS